MSADVAVLVATAVLAVVAVTAALVAVLAARRVARGAVAPAAPVATPNDLPGDLPGEPEVVAAEPLTVDLAPVRPVALEPRVVEGRVVVPPTQDQVVAAALGRPQARISVVAQGVAHALRPESRDRIGALVRREYRARRRARLRAGRRAARAANASPTPTAAADQWLGET
jgi:hypothetical protein